MPRKPGKLNFRKTRILLITSDNTSALPEKDALRQCDRLQFRYVSTFDTASFNPRTRQTFLNIYIFKVIIDQTHIGIHSVKKTYIYTYTRAIFILTVSVKVQTLLAIIELTRHIHIEINEKNDKTLYVKYNIFQY